MAHRDHTHEDVNDGDETEALSPVYNPPTETLKNGDASVPVSQANVDSSGGLKANITLFGGIMVIIGCIIGSGIFVSPKGVHDNAGSVGLSLIIWILCGVFSGIGAYCYAELGTFITKSGGDYAYVFVAFGPFAAFLRMWIECIIVRPCTLTAVAMTFALYILRPFFPHCEPPPYAPQLLAAGCLNYVKNFEAPFQGSNTDPGGLAMSFYFGLWNFSAAYFRAYNGWNYLNFVTEELENPTRNLPIAIGVSMVLCTVVYTLTNIAFYTGVTTEELLESSAVAVTFANRFYGVMAWIMPLFVAFSCFGTVNGVLLTSSRLFYVGAREGQMPVVLSMINYKLNTPMPAVLITSLLSLFYLLLSDNIFTLISYVQIVNWLAIGVATAGLLYLRRKQPPHKFRRPLQVWIGWPIIFLIGCIFLVVFPLIKQPIDTMIGLGIMFTGVPVYFVFVYWTSKPSWFKQALGEFTLKTQKLMLVVPEAKKQS